MKKITLIFMLLLSMSSFAQLALEGFEGAWTPLSGTEGTAGPAGWYIKNITGPVQRWGQATNGAQTPVTYGTRAAFINKENVATGLAEDWLITPLFTVPNNGQLKFYSRPTTAGQQNTTLKVMIGTNPADVSTFTELQSWTDGTINTVETQYEEKVLNMPAVSYNQQRYIAFVLMGDNGDGWLVDEVQVVEQCFAPTVLTANPSATSAVLGWTSASANFEVEVLPAAQTPLGVGVAVTGTSYTTPTTLTPSTQYQYLVRAVCAEGNYSPWAGPFTYNTSQIPALLNYTDGFEGPLTWSFINGTQTNKWAYGTATANGGTHALYISNDNGVTNGYTTVNAASSVHAYRDIQMPAALDQLLLSFDWKTAGETCCDYIRVWLAPVSYTPPTDNQIVATPENGLVQIGGNFNGSTNWSNYTATLNASAYGNSVRRLIFEWRNNGSVGTQPAGAIDNINLSLVTCPVPTNFVAGTVGATTATFSWTAPTSVAPSYDFYFSPNSTAPTASTMPTANIGTTPSLNLPSLTPGTTYYIWVRSNCGTGTSTWVGPIAFTTTQIPANLTLNQDFEGTHNFGFSNGNNVNKWVVGTATSNGGTRSLYVSNNNGLNNTYSATSPVTWIQAYRDIAITAGTSEVAVSFDWKGIGEGCCDYMQVFVVPSTYNPVANTQVTAANSGGVQLGLNFNQGANWVNYANTVNVAAYAGQTCRLVFQWRTDTGTQGATAAAVDNVNVSVVTCPRPAALTATPSNVSAILNWTPQGTEASWEVYVVTTGSAAPTAATVGTTVDTSTYTHSPLNGNTSYQYYVKAICSETEESLWAGPYTFNTLIANDNCDGAFPLPVKTTEACTQTTPVIFTGAAASTVPASACSTINGTDIWYQFTATDFSHNISLSNFTNATSEAAQNVIISVYENNCGAIGNAIGCSDANSLRVRNLTAGETYLIRLSLNAAVPALSTAFNICISTPVTPSSSNSSDCLVATINDSFETPPAGTSTNPTTWNENTIQGWRSLTSTGQIEFWPTPAALDNAFYGGIAANNVAYDGEWFLELNADNMGVIYQDFDTPVPTSFTVSFAHKGRYGTDKVRLLVGNADNDDYLSYDMVYEASTSNNIANNADNDHGWVVYGEAPNPVISYTVPAGQTKTRFVFQSYQVATHPNMSSSGNLLDKVVIKSDNSIITSSPAAADCVDYVVPVSAKGVGRWAAHTDNPSATVIADSGANNTTVTGFAVPGDYQYDWITDFCISTLVITYDAPVIVAPVATTAYAYCEGETAVTLSATAETGYTLHWYDVATGGTELTAAPTPVTTTPGTVTYYVNQSTGVCEGPRLPITVTVNEIPDAPVATDVVYCEDAVAIPLTATATAGNTLNWYNVATGGTALAAAPTPDTSVAGTTTFYVSQSTTANCESPRTAVTVTVNAPGPQDATFTVPVTVCIAGANPVATLTAAAATGGTFTSSVPADLIIDAVTGEIDLAASIAGTYIITYTVAADSSCLAEGTSQQTITVTPLAIPVTTFNYVTACVDSANQLATLATGFPATGAVYTSSDPANLIVDPATGEIDMALSVAGTYTVTVNFAQDAVNCIAAATNTAPVVITPLTVPVAGFTYTDVCATAANQLPSLATGFVTGGQYSSTTGLSIDSTTGEVNIAASTPGDYTITYTLLPAACRAGAVTNADITISPAATPITGFTYTDVCATAANQLPSLATGFASGGVYSSTAGLSINAATGEINVAASTPDTYVVTYTTTADAVSCIAASVTTENITISPAVTPVTAFDFDASYCFGTGIITPDLETGFVSGGTFTATGGLNINAATGELSLANAAPGSYSVVYTIPADAVACNAGGSTTVIFTVGTEILFTIDGACNGSAFILTATPEDGSFDPATVAYQWRTTSGTPIGTDNETFNVNDYVNSTTATETFPMDFVLTVTSNNCSTSVTYTVQDISCEIQRGISPGGSDGLNDFFDLASLGVRKLTIFNRYGLEVYARNNYTTEWVGQTNGGDELPTGTYFYVIDRNAGESKTGWIYINRHE